MKKKIAFISPIWEGGPTILYENLVKKLNETYGEIFSCEHIHTLWWWIFSHFKKYDTVVSVIPLLWRPRCQKFFINIHGDLVAEKLNTSAGRFLKHLYPKNIKIADNVVFPSFWLANRISPQKNIVIYNIISDIFEKNLQTSEKNEFFTITSFHFYEKWKWILEIIHNLESLKKPYTFHIFGGGTHLENVKNLIPKSKNTIIFHGFLPREKIFQKIPQNSIFLYHSELDIIPTSILETAKMNFPILIGFLPQFEEFFDEKILYKNTEEFGKKLENLRISPQILEKFDTQKNLEKWKKILIS